MTRPQHSSLTDLARSTADAWRADPDDPATRSRYYQAVLRLHYSTTPPEVIAEQLGLDHTEVQRIAYGQMGLTPPIIDNAEEVCTFCGRMRRQVTRLVDGPSVRICGECADTARSVLQDGRREEQPGWHRVSPIGPPKCDFCGRINFVDGVVVPDRYAHICADCIDEAQRG